VCPQCLGRIHGGHCSQGIHREVPRRISCVGFCLSSPRNTLTYFFRPQGGSCLRSAPSHSRSSDGAQYCTPGGQSIHDNFSSLMVILMPALYQHAKTIFKRLRYDANTDTSVVHCACILLYVQSRYQLQPGQPMTGRCMRPFFAVADRVDFSLPSSSPA
jgi:hypothetical protein